MKTFKIIFRIIACLIFCTFLFVGYKVLNSVFISHIDTVLDVVNTEEEKYIKYYNEFMNREEISENDYRAFIDGVNNFLIEDYERNKKLYSSQRTIINLSLKVGAIISGFVSILNCILYCFTISKTPNAKSNKYLSMFINIKNKIKS